MRTAQSPSIDFNQMLVVSVFFHFFLFTVFMFLPQTQKIIKRIKPITVSFVNIPAGPDIQPAPQVKETPIAPLPPVKPIPQKAKPVPEKPVPSKAITELDKLTQLEKKKAIPKKDKLAMAVPKPKESILEDFEKIKMKTETEKKPTRKVIAKDDLTLEELEFEHLSKQSATREPQNKSKKTSSLLKELDELDELNKQAQAALNQSSVGKTDFKANELLKQLDSIKKESVQIKIDTSRLSSQHSQKFKSEIRNLKMADLQRKAVGPAASGELGDPDTEVIELYRALVGSKINEQWKDPLGGGTGMVHVSFTIFPKGNISTPKIVKSSGESKLDNLAIRAVKNAAPLPPFPKEVKEPNLPLTIEFTYEPSKS